MSNKIAILLFGHVRNLNIVQSLPVVSNSCDFDVFVFAWDNPGHKGTETNINDNGNFDYIKQQIESIPNVKRFKIESNAEFIKNNQNNTIKYFNHSSPEVFIKSQLYAVQQSYKLMENYSAETNQTYNMVIKCRMDCAFYHFILDDYLLQELQRDIIFVTSRGTHEHPDYSTGCWACDNMYYRHGLRGIHIFEHTNVICDIFAYGSMKSMKDYCSLYEHYDRLNKQFEEENLRSLQKNPHVGYAIEDNVYKFSHVDSVYFFKCSYPERLLPVLLKDYMLVTSDKIRMSMHR